ncbi:MAG: hypothetical protein HY381_00050 [Candidatus Chisholmbacteria bacterium]|nr:hypothetical protein [Candidatus Chisholmbacteria bacterium]
MEALRDVEIKQWTDFLSRVHGTRIYFMDLAQVPPGWVVDARPGDPMWPNVRARAIPLKPQDAFLGIRWGPAGEAYEDLQQRQFQFGPHSFMLMVPDEETEGGWTARMVNPEDLLKSPQELMQLANQLAIGDSARADSLRCAYLAVSAAPDTKNILGVAS